MEKTLVMKNILICIPTLKKGGCEKQAALLASVLKDDFNVKIVLFYPKSGFEPELVKISGLEDEDIIKLSGSMLQKMWQLGKTIRKGKFDTMFCYLTAPDFYGTIVGRLCGVKKIYLGLRNAYLPKGKIVLERIASQFATSAIVNNFAGVDVFSKFGIKKQIVIPNCYPSPHDYKVHHEREFVEVITVARFVAQKDYATAIGAFAMASKQDERLRFKIIGHGELESEIRQMVKIHSIDDKVKILINPPKIIEHLLDSDIYLSTSLFEGTSNSIMEAMDASLPIIATNVGDNSHLVRDGVNGYITNIKDIDTISSKLLKLSSSSQMRAEMGRKGNEILHTEYSVEKFRESYQSLINSDEKQ